MLQKIASARSPKLQRAAFHCTSDVLMYLGGGPPHLVIVAIRDKKDYIRVLLYFYYTTIAGWGCPKVCRGRGG